MPPARTEHGVHRKDCTGKDSREESPRPHKKLQLLLKKAAPHLGSLEHFHLSMHAVFLDLVIRTRDAFVS